MLIRPNPGCLPRSLHHHPRLHLCLPWNLSRILRLPPLPFLDLRLLLLHLLQHPLHNVHLERSFRDHLRRLQNANAVVIAAHLHQNVRRIQPEIYIAGLQIHRLQIQHVRLVEFFVALPVQHRQAVVSRRKSRIQLNRRPQALLHLLAGRPIHHRKRAEIVLCQITVRIERNCLRVPLLRLITMPCAKFNEPHRLVRLNVVGIRL